MRMSNRNIILILSILSFSMLTLYWVLSEIMFNENKDRVDKIQKFSAVKENQPDLLTLAARKQTPLSNNVDIGLEAEKLLALYAAISVKTNDESSLATNLACASEIFVSECDNAGLAGMLLMALDHIGTCRELGAEPTVFWRNCGTVCSSHASINSWNWFFDPINPNIEKKAKTVLCFVNYFGSSILSYGIGNKIGIKRRKTNRTRLPDLLNLSFKSRNIGGFSPFELITRDVRYWAHGLLKQYVKINAEIQEIVDQFYDQHLFGYTVLAVHVRGTDHYLETEDGKLPLLTSWIQNAKYILKSLPTPNKIFIASDNSESIKKFVSVFGKKVVFTNAFRAIKYYGKEIHTSKYDPYRLGAEVLIDILLLAKGDHLLHAESSVAALACYFNPDMHTHFLESKANNKYKDDAVKRPLFGHVGDVNVNMEDFQYEYSDDPKSSVDDMKVAMECFKKNSQYSFCPNTRKGIFLPLNPKDTNLKENI